MHRSRLLRIAPASTLALLVLALAAELVPGRGAIAIAAALALITAASEAWPWLAGRREATRRARARGG